MVNFTLLQGGKESSSSRGSSVVVSLEDGISDTERDIGRVYDAISKAAQLVSKQLPFRLGMTKQLNPFGEKQAELDVFSNETFAKALLDTAQVGWVASEELEKPLGGFRQTSDSLAIAMDPLDGSSNIATNNPLGSIFGIWRGEIPKKGRELAAAAFVTYGPTLTLTLTCNGRVDQYVEVKEGENPARFVRGYTQMKLPESPEVYSFGAPRSDWIPEIERFVSRLEMRKMHLRFCGTMIGDYNQVLQRGGIFSYPRHKAKPQGKLRICYETAPVSYINELAGGSSSDGEKSILEILPDSFTQTSPFYVGNTELIRELESELSQA